MSLPWIRKGEAHHNLKNLWMLWRLLGLTLPVVCVNITHVLDCYTHLWSATRCSVARVRHDMHREKVIMENCPSDIYNHTSYTNGRNLNKEASWFVYKYLYVLDDKSYYSLGYDLDMPVWVVLSHTPITFRNALALSTVKWKIHVHCLCPSLVVSWKDRPTLIP